MKTVFKLITIGLIACNSIFAQQKLQVIRAKSDKVDIKDGNNFHKGIWTISPQLKPDVYTTSNKNKKVTFYTDLDSISFIISPDKKYNFIILLNNKDSALTEIIYKESYLEVLKKSGKYNPQENTKIPAFTYQSKDNTNLVALRKAFNLDSIAGTGNEISQIINLMHWIHYLVPHDGQHGNPEIKNAMNMIAVCKKEKRGLNCRGLATVLNECYLSMGFKSRFITCLPKDTADPDCHVINMVYSNTFKKWVWIDPTNDAYVMNEKGELLSIEEVRDRLLNDKPLILNPDANWNRKSSQTVEEYLEKYMAKNLYRIECPVNSEFDTETKVDGKVVTYIQLLTTDDFNKQLTDGGTKSKKGSKHIIYKTCNPGIFWKAPENDQYVESTLKTKIDTTNLNLKSLAEKICKNDTTNLGKATTLLNWTGNSLEWLPTDYKQRTVKEILARGGGNCFEIAKVYMALIQAMEIKYRPIAEINIQPNSESRQKSAEQKVKQNGNSMSVFGGRHNDHRWVEIYDSNGKTWVPADPSMNVIGMEQWIKARAGFEKRITKDTSVTNSMIVPFAIFVTNNSNHSIIENRTQYYLEENFNKIYSEKLSGLPSWNSWISQLKAINEFAKSAFEGKANLHYNTVLIENIDKTYQTLKKEYKEIVKK